MRKATIQNTPADNWDTKVVEHKVAWHFTISGANYSYRELIPLIGNIRFFR